jgi:hypothetical protein
MSGYLRNVAVSCSQLLNALLGGDPDMTVSASAHVRSMLGGSDRARAVIDAVFFFEKDHCRQSFERDVAFATKVRDLQERIFSGR